VKYCQLLFNLRGRMSVSLKRDRRAVQLRPE